MAKNIVHTLKLTSNQMAEIVRSHFENMSATDKEHIEKSCRRVLRKVVLKNPEILQRLTKQ